MAAPFFHVRAHPERQTAFAEPLRLQALQAFNNSRWGVSLRLWCSSRPRPSPPSQRQSQPRFVARAPTSAMCWAACTCCSCHFAVACCIATRVVCLCHARTRTQSDAKGKVCGAASAKQPKPRISRRPRFARADAPSHWLLCARASWLRVQEAPKAADPEPAKEPTE